MTYRDDLVAAQERITALEAELDRARRKIADEVGAVAAAGARDRGLLHAQLEQQRRGHERALEVEREAWRYRRQSEIEQWEQRAAAQEQLIESLREQLRALEDELERARSQS